MDSEGEGRGDEGKERTLLRVERGRMAMRGEKEGRYGSGATGNDETGRCDG